MRTQRIGKAEGFHGDIGDDPLIWGEENLKSLFVTLLPLFSLKKKCSPSQPSATSGVHDVGA